MLLPPKSCAYPPCGTSILTGCPNSPNRPVLVRNTSRKKPHVTFKPPPRQGSTPASQQQDLVLILDLFLDLIAIPQWCQFRTWCHLVYLVSCVIFLEIIECAHQRTRTRLRPASPRLFRRRRVANEKNDSQMPAKCNLVHMLPYWLGGSAS